MHTYKISVSQLAYKSYVFCRDSSTSSRKLCVCATVFCALLGCNLDGCKSTTNSLKKL